MPSGVVRVCWYALPALGLLAAGLRAPTPVLTGQYDNSRTGGTVTETVLDTTNVNSSQFGKVGSFPTDGAVFAQPLYVPNVSIGGRTVNALYVATMHNSVYAFNADQPNQPPLWQVTLDPSVPAGAAGTCPAAWSTGSELGILSTPVIDSSTGTLYAVDSTPIAGGYENRLYALNIGTGQPQFGSPVSIAAQVTGTGLDSVGGVVSLTHTHYIQRPALLLANGNVYAGFGSCGPDPTPFHGWIIGYNAGNVQQQTVVYNTTPNGDEGAVWQSGHGLVSDASGSIYFMTGNGDFDGGPDFGSSFQKLSPAGTLVDWFTPPNFALLDSEDLDLGSAGPILIPGADVLVGGGKQGIVYVLDPSNMGQQNAPLQSFQATAACTALTPGGCCEIHGLAYLDSASNPLLYVWGAHDNLRAYRLLNGVFNTTPDSQNSQISGSNLAVSSDGGTAATAVLWAVTTSVLHAFQATNVAVELWNSVDIAARDSLGTAVKYVLPVIANGRVYVATAAGVVVYGLNPPVYVSLSPASASLSVGQQQQFTPVVGAANPGLNWTLSPAAGTLTFTTTASGANTYTAPSIVTTATTVILTATSIADPTKSATATISLTPVVIGVSPTAASLIGAQKQALTATVSGSSNAAVNWSVSPPNLGTLSSTTGAGIVYTAPSSISVAQTVIVTATSAADPTKSASAAMTLVPPATGAYAYVRAVTILHANVPNEDQPNFPFLFNTTDPLLRSVANGGHVASANGYDIVFCADPAGLTRLNFELQSYNPATGQVTAWVRIPTLSHTSDTTLYLFYGNAAVTASQASPAAVWDSHFMGVWHTGKNSSLSGADSTANANNGVIGADTTPVAGLLGETGNFDGTWNAYIDMGAASTLDISGPFTLSTWFKETAYTANYEVLMSKCSGVACNYELALDGSNQDLEGVQNANIVQTGVVPSMNQWHYAVETSDGTHLYFYLDGVLVSTLNAGTGSILTGTHFDLGREKVDGENFDGILEEARLSNINRDANWIAAEYNNQATAQFYLFGPENPSTWSNGYAHRRAVTIAHANVANSNQTNFPFLFNTADPLFRSLANGGHVASANGYDIIFCADSAGLTRLNYELQSYNPATGQVTAWVRIPTLSHTSDTTLYLFYGNPAVTTSQASPAAVWDSNFMGVWHTGTNSLLSGADSTANANNGVIGADTTPVAGLLGEAGNFDGTWNAYIDMGTASTLDLGGPFTLSTWFKETAYTGNYEVLMSKCSGVACNYELALDGSNQDLEGVQNTDIVQTGVVPSMNQWHYAVETSDGTHLYFYLDGVLVSTLNAGTGSILAGTHFDLGREKVDGENFDGILEEARLSNITRSANWIATEYNNQHNTAAFYSVGAEQ